MRSTLTGSRADIARATYKYGGFEPMHPDPYSFPGKGENSNMLGAFQRKPHILPIVLFPSDTLASPLSHSYFNASYYLLIYVALTGPRYTGLELLIWSTYAKEHGGLTWYQLDAVIQGLQQALCRQQKYREAQFMIYDGLTEKAEQGTGELYSVSRLVQEA